MKVQEYLFFLISFTALFLSACTTCILLSLNWLFVNPLSRKWHRKLSTFFSYTWFLNVPFTLEKWCKINLVMLGDQLDASSSALFLLNHRANVDWLLYIAWISTYGFPYPGQFKAVAKAELSHIPAFGWLLYLSDFIFLKRKWETDRIYITSRLRDLSNFSESGFPLSILIFPEGTRLTPQKLENSQNFARSNGLFVFNKLLYPRFKGFLGLMPIIRSKLDYLVDCTLIFKQGIPTIADVLKGKADQTVHLHIRKFPVSEIPEEPDSLKEWLRQKWIEKEKIIESYEKNPKLLQSGAMPCNGPPSYIGCYILHLLTATLCGNLIYQSTNVKYGLQVLILSITLFFGVCIAIGRRSLSNSKIGIAPSNNEISKQSNYSKK